MVGVGGTGKSLLFTVLGKLFAPNVVESLAAKREEVFGMANLLDKELLEVVFGRDMYMPTKMSNCLPQEILQAMTSGEQMEIPIKGQEARHLKWTARVVMAILPWEATPCPIT